MRAESHRLVAQAYLLVRDFHVAEDLAQRTLEHSPELTDHRRYWRSATRRLRDIPKVI